MPCFHPIEGFRRSDGGFCVSSKDSPSKIRMCVPCGQCVGCRLKKAGGWTQRLMNEKSGHEFAWFVTPTYSDEHLPDDYSCHVGHLQAFHHRIRAKEARDAKREGRAPNRFRFHAVSDYGSQFFRPHYHGSYFGLCLADARPARPSKGGYDQFESDELTALWGMGEILFSPLTRETCGYTARHNLEKVNGGRSEAHYTRLHPGTGELVRVRPEFMICSRRPGIGAAWFDEFERDVFPSDFLIHQGKKIPVPDYYVRKVKGRFDGPGSDPDSFVLRDDFSAVRAVRRAKAASPQNVANCTPERMAVREEVTRLRVSRLKREL